MSANSDLVKELVDTGVGLLVMFLTGAAYVLLNDATDFLPDLARIFGIVAVASIVIAVVRVYVRSRTAP
ncbi:MAG TPA: hypothetical protein VFX33_04260 [Actinomycetales bacterium]|nr:hypothetical protein [Actinomycetales bacterium]